jgi:3-polyprenyl-4-hydroxybenzoate decarboxylase
MFVRPKCLVVIREDPTFVLERILLRLDPLHACTLFGRPPGEATAATQTSCRALSIIRSQVAFLYHRC